MAAVKPRRLNVSLVWVPLPERAVKTAFEPFFIAASTVASSVGLPGYAHSPSVIISKVVPSISTFTVDLAAKG